MFEPDFNQLDLHICDDIFDQVDDLLDFPDEDIEGDIVGGDSDGLKDVWPAQVDTLAGSCSLFSDGNFTHSTSELPTEFPVPYEDIAQLEWLSNFMEDSFSAGSISLDQENSLENKNINSNNNDSHLFQAPSPVSVLESSSSSSCSGGQIKLCPETVVTGRGRARSKRARPAAFNPRPMVPLASPVSSLTDPFPPFSPSELLPEFEYFTGSYPETKIPTPIGTEQKTKKKRKLSAHSGVSSHTMVVRKCMHCEITKTPQWRSGPMGPKTLCNACGVRYKTGRLFPEYRPAASPTFVATLHSNSHKKVIEMRNNASQKMGASNSHKKVIVMRNKA